MSCEEVLATLDELLTRPEAGIVGGAVLPPAVSLHLESCASCRRAAEELRRVVALVKTLPGAGPSTTAAPPSWGEVERRIRSRRRPLLRALLRAAVVVLALLAGGLADRLLLRPSRDDAGRSARREPERPQEKEAVRRALSKSPGSLGSQLAALRALSGNG
ncbi:hypothetical protein HY251_16025 [bacterium]|nr:hypothetical protein [bacterium]